MSQDGDSTIPRNIPEFNAVIANFIAYTDKVEVFVNGDNSTTFSTASGTHSSIAKIQKDFNDQRVILFDNLQNQVTQLSDSLTNDFQTLRSTQENDFNTLASTLENNNSSNFNALANNLNASIDDKLDSLNNAFLHLGKSATQLIGSGNNGTNVLLTWDEIDHNNIVFGFSVGGSLVNIYETARYRLIVNLNYTHIGANRTSLAIHYRKNGVNVLKGRKVHYCRGQNYGSFQSMGFEVELDLEDGDNLEIVITRLDSDTSSYTQTTRANECELILRKIS